MEISSLTSILLVIVFILAIYFVLTDQVTGTTKIILVIFILVLGLLLASSLSMFKTYNQVLDSPKPANAEFVYSDLPIPTASFSLSTWIYIDDWNTEFGSEKNILSLDRPGATPTQLILDKNENNLLIRYDVYDGQVGSTRMLNQTITIQNIPIQKWVNIVVCFDANSTDTYINGKLIDTQLNPSPLFTPKKADKLYLCKGNKGFSGSISNSRYYGRFLSPQEVWDIYKGGFSDNLFGNLLNRYKANFTFYQDSEEVAKFILF
jgi:hypothetical protein